MQGRDESAVGLFTCRDTLRKKGPGGTSVVLLRLANFKRHTRAAVAATFVYWDMFDSGEQEGDNIAR